MHAVLHLGPPRAHQFCQRPQRVHQTACAGKQCRRSFRPQHQPHGPHRPTVAVVLALIQAAGGTSAPRQCTCPASRTTSMLDTIAGKCDCASSAGASTTTPAISQGCKSEGTGTKRCMPGFCTRSRPAHCTSHPCDTRLPHCPTILVASASLSTAHLCHAPCSKSKPPPDPSPSQAPPTFGTWAATPATAGGP